MVSQSSWQPPPTDANLNSICLEYSYKEILAATNGFHEKHLLGKGAYGSVFKGELKDGTEVAIKVLHAPREGGFKEEVQVLSKFRHPNLVILMGFARNGHQRFLVYELLQGGDICSRVQKDPSFDYKQRISVALDAALGLSHLHNASPKVFHRDVKSQNILLDKNSSGRIADFGLALLAKPRAGTNGLVVEQCSGTVGYADPLYIASSIVTERREVYSFGMVMLELLTAKPPALANPNNHQVEYTYDSVKASIEDVVKMAQTSADWPPDIARFWAQLSLACVQDSETHRPVFVEIVGKLRKLKAHVNKQKLPQEPTKDITKSLETIRKDQETAEVKPPTWNPFARTAPAPQVLPLVQSEPRTTPVKDVHTIEEVLDRLFGPELESHPLIEQLTQLGFSREQAVDASKTTQKLQVAVDYLLAKNSKN
jgi:serine/threonine protein kinase